MIRDSKQAIAELERSLKQHPQAEVKNLEWIKGKPHSHDAAVANAIIAMLGAFPTQKSVYLLEAELLRQREKSRPEDIVAWIEGTGIFVIEAKSHQIDGIRSFENNVPQVIYGGRSGADKDLLDQPRSFAYKMRGFLELACEDEDLELPALYYAGWMPFVTCADVANRNQQVSREKVWLADMLEPETLRARLPAMKNVTGREGARRETLEVFSQLFGTSSGLRSEPRRRSLNYGSMGQQIDEAVNSLKRLTKEQEDLAFSPRLLSGCKVIRGVAGSGKTVVLANAVAEAFLAEEQQRAQTLYDEESKSKKILVLCYNRSLVPYLEDLTRQCFEARRAHEGQLFPEGRLKVMNIDRFAWQYSKLGTNDVEAKVRAACEAIQEAGVSYDHVLVDEGQDIALPWYEMLRALARPQAEGNRSIVVFYDEAQNIYGHPRPGTGNSPVRWRELLGEIPHRRGLRTVMRVGHRNSNQILTFSFNLLLGAFAERSSQMATYAGLAEYEKETIDHDPAVSHPRAGKPCVERLNPDRPQYRVNFAVRNGPRPTLHVHSRNQQIREFVRELRRELFEETCRVDPVDILVMAPLQEDLLELGQALRQEKIAFRIAFKPKGNLSPAFRDLGSRRTREMHPFIAKVTSP
jgi:hypothetical protein